MKFYFCNVMYTTIQKVGVGKIFFSLILTKAAFIWSKML